MRKELQDALVKDFPKAYPCLTKECKCDHKMVMPMHFGFEVGDGWEPLVRRLSEVAVNVGAVVFQVKEKFGGLRFYTNSSEEALERAVRANEEASFKICEDCGAPGERRDGGWIRTLCDRCEEKRNERKSGLGGGQVRSGVAEADPRVGVQVSEAGTDAAEPGVCCSQEGAACDCREGGGGGQE